MNDLDLKALWQAPSSGDVPTMSLEDVKGRVRAFERKIQRRNVLEWGASALVVMWFGSDALAAESLLLMVGNLLVVAAALGISFYLWRRGRVALRSDPTKDTRSFVEAHAGALNAQARLLAAVPFWYLAPLSVGLTVLMAGRLPADGRPIWPWCATVAFIILVFLGVAWLNHRAARTMREEAQALLAELD